MSTAKAEANQFLLISAPHLNHNPNLFSTCKDTSNYKYYSLTILHSLTFLQEAPRSLDFKSSDCLSRSFHDQLRTE